MQNDVKRLRLAGAVTLALGLAAGGALAQDYPAPDDTAALYEAAKQEGTLTWYISGPVDSHRAMADDFEAKFPGVSVQIARYNGVAQYQKFLQETDAKSYVADILSMTDYPSMSALAKDGYLASWKVPTFDRFPDYAKIEDKAYALYNSDVAVVYNINKVTPEEVELIRGGWEALLDPRFKGRYGLTTQPCSTCFFGVSMFLDPQYEDRYGEPFLRKLAANMATTYPDTLVLLDRVVAGEHDLAVWEWEGGALAKWAQGAPVRWVFPKPTPSLTITYSGIPSVSPHPNAARLFQTWYLSEEGAISEQKHNGNMTNIAGVPDVRGLSDQDWYKPLEEPYHVADWNEWAKNFAPYTELWTKIQQEEGPKN